MTRTPATLPLLACLVGAVLAMTALGILLALAQAVLSP